MRIAVFGLGYVGSVTAASLAELGHEVVGVDIKDEKVEAVNAGEAPVSEPGLSALVKRGREEDRLRATTDAGEAVRDTEMALLCVGTPSRSDGSHSMDALRSVAENVGSALEPGRPNAYVVVVRSTTVPGTLASVVRRGVMSGGPALGSEDVAFAVNPEFMREGSALEDFRRPPFVVAAGDEAALTGLRRLYADIDAPFVEAGVREAEMLKLVSNTFHALKVVFANEIGTLCAELDVDGGEVMELFCRDTVLNLSSKYLSPGFAFGGSCLPKDLRALVHAGEEAGLELPVVRAIEPSNQVQIRRAFRKVEAGSSRRVGLLGLTFKSNTDDLRESPFVALAEILIGKGYDVSIYDPNLDLEALVGANRSFLEDAIPHVAKLLCSTGEEVLARSDVVVKGYDHPEFSRALDGGEHDVEVVDLTRSLSLGTMRDSIPLWSNARPAGLA